jgi:hypothetical protein
MISLVGAPKETTPTRASFVGAWASARRAMIAAVDATIKSRRLTRPPPCLCGRNMPR